MITKPIQNNDILVVDDEISNLKLLSELLEKEGYQVRPASNAQSGIDSALAKPPGLILLDVRMPEMDGFEVCRRLKQDKRTQNVPIIFVSALQDIEARTMGFEAGGVDFISKPFQDQEILARVGTHMHLNRMQKRLEKLVDERTEKLRESEVRFRTVVENANETIVVTQDEVVKYCNPKINELTGYTPEEVQSRGFDNFIHPEDLEIAMREYQARLSGEQPTASYSIRIYTKEKQEKHVLINSALVEWDGKSATLAMLTDITDRKLAEIELRGAYEEIEQLKNQLEAESAYLQEEIKSDHNFENIIGKSDTLKYVLHRVSEVASTDAPVLILGETGTGKELIARAVHDASSRNKHALVKINCANLPAALIESELFGHEKGAFTGADARRIGRFQLADKATLFLDEISEIPIDLQAKLLRVLQDGEFEPVGSSKTVKTDVRIIAATNRSLDEEVNDGRFRSDLLYRINVFPITVPPLRHRKEDIPLLVNWFVDKFNRKMGKGISSIPATLIKHLQSYDWPGNIRELENVIERAIITSKNSVLKLTEKLAANSSKPAVKTNQTLAEVERDHLLKTVEATGWKIEGNNGAAQLLGLAPSTVRSRMKKLGIKRPE